MRFRNRHQAGLALAAALEGRSPRPALVAGIPRGGVIVALPVAERLAAPLAVVYARKLTTPSWPELAFGAVDEEGFSFVDQATAANMGLGPEEVAAATDRVREEIRRRIALYRVPPLSHWLPGRSVVLVDDGLATGLTMRAGVELARRHGARHVTVAVPCAPDDAASRFEGEMDNFVSLILDPHFRSVGDYYDEFPPVPDSEVLAALALQTTAGESQYRDSPVRDRLRGN